MEGERGLGAKGLRLRVNGEVTMEDSICESDFLASSI